MRLNTSHVLCDLLLRHKYLSVIVVLLFVSLLITYNLFSSITLPVSHDIIFHVFQADQFDRALKSGATIPRWALNSNNGYGSPNFIFYAPLSYYAISAIHSIGPSLLSSLKVVIWLGFFLSGLTMFTALNKISSSRGSLPCAILYQILPFHVVDLYCRGTLAELAAFIWFPLIIMYVHDLFQAKGSKTIGIRLSLSYAGLILTHLVSGFIFTLVIGAYFLFNCIQLKDYYTTVRTFFFLLIGLGLSSFYLIPSIFERQFVQLDYLFKYAQIGTYKDNFLFMSTRIDNFNLLLDFIVILYVMIFIVLLVRLWKIKNWQSHIHNPFFIYMFPVVFVLMTPLTKPLWDIFPGFATLQFPWRWISMLEVALCFVLHSLCFNIGTKFTWEYPLNRLLVYLLGTVLVVSCSIVATKHFYSLKDIERVTVFDHSEINNNLPREYTPIAVTALEELLASGRSEKLSVLSGIAVPRILEWQPEQRTIIINASTPAQLKVGLFYYPGWSASLDGSNIPIKIQNGSGATIIDIPDGNHILTLRFTDTLLRQNSKYLSLFFLIVVLGCLSLFYMKTTHRLKP